MSSLEVSSLFNIVDRVVRQQTHEGSYRRVDDAIQSQNHQQYAVPAITSCVFCGEALDVFLRKNKVATFYDFMEPGCAGVHACAVRWINTDVIKCPM